MNKLSYWWISLIIVFLDQFSKILVRMQIAPGEIIRVTSKFFWLTHVENDGAAFSLSLGSSSLNQIIYPIIIFLAMILMVYLNIRSKTKTEKFIYALILGGALGNFIDRILLGRVTDFLWCDFPDFIMERWPVFNIADSAIVIAIVIMFVNVIFPARKSLED
ncbi:MAG: signal peptidase II [Candidatus Cloacimonetes bacterium]|nr:signal peptidase II [Candidatus Cloacimonadota bacterium]